MRSVNTGEQGVRLVVKKVTSSIKLRFPVFGVDVTKEVSASELRQFYGELTRLEAAVNEQSRKISSIVMGSSNRVQASEER